MGPEQTEFHRANGNFTSAKHNTLKIVRPTTAWQQASQAEKRKIEEEKVRETCRVQLVRLIAARDALDALKPEEKELSKKEIEKRAENVYRSKKSTVKKKVISSDNYKNASDVEKNRMVEEAVTRESAAHLAR